MSRVLAMLAAYAATALLVPFLFVAAMFIFSPPLPRGLIFMPLLLAYLLTALMGFLAGLPGFLLGRLGLLWADTGSVIAFVLAGSLAGYVATVLLCMPAQLWVLRKYNVDLVGTVIGGIAGLIYQRAERILVRAVQRKADI